MKKSRTGLMVLATLAFSMSCGSEDNPTPPRGDTTAPAQVTDLAAVGASQYGITLTWTAPGDDNNTGTAYAYDIRESAATINSSNWAAATQVALAPPPGTPGDLEIFTFTGFDTLQVHYFALRTGDEAGNWSPISNNAKWEPRTGAVSYTVVIPSFKDNTMYEESDTLSNAKGEHFYSGNNNGGASAPADARRGLLAFAIADSIPAGAMIDSVALELTMTKGRALVPTSSVSLHRLLASWGEGTSIANLNLGEGGGGVASPGDATWLDRFRGTSLWTNPGGDFDVAASASVVTTVPSPATTPVKYTWTSPGMVDDVQAWLDTPASNFGWLVKGDETVDASARQWDSRENPDASKRPKLTVFYTVTP